MLDLRGNLVLGQGVYLTLRIADRGPQILRGGVGLADHLAALADRRLQPIGFAHGSPLGGLLDRESSKSRPAVDLGATRRRPLLPSRPAPVAPARSGQTVAGRAGLSRRTGQSAAASPGGRRPA